MVLHVTASAGWIGVEAALLTLCFAGLPAAGARPPGPAYAAAGQAGSYLAFVACLLALASGLLLAVGTPWGLLRYYWVTLKFALVTAIVLADIVVVNRLLSSAFTELAWRQAGAGGGWFGGPRSLLVTAGIGQLCVLAAAMLLAVFKPWGRSRYGRGGRHTQPPA
ncbi:MAG TPA: hypothetical protein VH641_18090 [Streptosporangiaceae bacterium]|jgi:hypothetical protein